MCWRESIVTSREVDSSCDIYFYYSSENNIKYDRYQYTRKLRLICIRQLKPFFCAKLVFIWLKRNFGKVSLVGLRYYHTLSVNVSVLKILAFYEFPWNLDFIEAIFRVNRRWLLLLIEKLCCVFLIFTTSKNTVYLMWPIRIDYFSQFWK